MTATAKRKHRKITEGVVHIQATFNNTKFTVTDPQGNTVASSSAGACGFRGSRKGTPYGAQLAAETVGRKVIDDFEMKRIVVCVRGPGAGRDSAIRGLRSSGLEIICLEDRTRLPHNGCRPRKKRRV